MPRITDPKSLCTPHWQNCFSCETALKKYRYDSEFYKMVIKVAVKLIWGASWLIQQLRGKTEVI